MATQPNQQPEKNDSAAIRRFEIAIDQSDLAPDGKSSREDNALQCIDHLIDVDHLGDTGTDYVDTMVSISHSTEYRDLVDQLADGRLLLTFFAAGFFMAGRLSVGLPQ